MQRGGGSDGETPYTNHGVLPNHSHLRTGFADRDSKDSSKTDTTPVSSLSCPDKDRLYPGEPREVTNAEIIRQNLARDYPMHKRQGTLRPGSPAEREKHRIHSVDRIEDVDTLLEASSLHTHRSAKTGDFRKSLSSTCVSSFPRTRTAQCQTSDDLVFNLLSPLRRRRVSRSKNKLERSGAVDDPPAACAKEVNVFNYPSQCHSKSLTIRRSTMSSPRAEDFRSSPSTFPKLSLPVVYQSYQSPNCCSMSELDTQESSCLLGTCDDNMQRRHSHNIPRSDRYHNYPDHLRRGSNDASALLLSEPCPLQTFKPDVLTSSDTSELSFLEGIEKLENSVSPVCQNRYSQFSGRQSKDLPEQELSPTRHHVSKANLCCTSSEASPSSLTHQESYCSTISTTSSSFTLPPFPNSVDSNPSDETFADSDNNFDIEDLDDYSRRTTRKGSSPEDECVNTLQSKSSQCRGDNSLNTINSCSKTPGVVPSGEEKSGDDVLEFQKYLQGHGVQLDLCTIQSSDL